MIQYGALVLFAAVFVEQIGLPLPAVPLLIAAGALAGAGKLNLALALGLPVVASLLADLVWYYLGLSHGRRVLNLLCRIALEPDSCVRRTENAFTRHGVRSLLVAKFIPGLSTVAPPLAGIMGMSPRRFLLYDGLGALIWTGAYGGLGYIFSDQLERIAESTAQFGGSLIILLAGALAAYILYKYVQRQHLLYRLRGARITASELKEKLDAGEDLVIVDLRPPVEVLPGPPAIPGALRMAMEELGRRHQEIPRDRDVILYCDCPNETTSARAALLLRGKGITRVRPLAGGIDAWHALIPPLDVAAGRIAPAVTLTP